MSNRGWTVMELLVVILIIALLVALLLPLIMQARRNAQQAPCMTNLRQIHVAWAMYIQDYEGGWPSLPALARSARAVFACPSDPLPNGLNSRVHRFTGIRGSYFYVSSTPTFGKESQEFVEHLSQADSNHGIVACILHGKRTSGPLHPGLGGYKGIVLRLRRDGSVQKARRTGTCKDGVRSQCIWDLMTDNRNNPSRREWCPGEGMNAHPCD